MDDKYKGKWIGVDLDGTLAEWHGFQGASHIGAPIPTMVMRVLGWLNLGIEVRIFTARANPDFYQDQTNEFMQACREWCARNLGKVLDITYLKDQFMIELWDDRAISVQLNTGRAYDANAKPWTLAEARSLETAKLPNLVKLPAKEPNRANVPDLLRGAAQTYEERQKTYGSNYKDFGKVMTSLFPKGITLDSEEAWVKVGLLLNSVTKLARYCGSMQQGLSGHADSAHDLSVYASMLEEVTINQKQPK